MQPMPRRLAAAVGAVVLAASFATDRRRRRSSIQFGHADGRILGSALQANHPFTLTAAVDPITAGFDTDAPSTSSTRTAVAMTASTSRSIPAT